MKVGKRLGLYELTEEVTLGLVRGNLLLTGRDFRIPGHLPIAFNRTYNSETEQMGPLGFGWSHEYHRSLSIHEERIIYHNELLQQLHFHKNEEGRWVAPADHNAELRETSEGYALGLVPGQFFHFDGGGRLLAIRYRDGAALNFEYDAGRLASIGNNAGRKLRLSYADSGLLTEVSGEAGGEQRRVRYHHDEEGNLVGVTDPMGRTTSYAYRDHNLYQVKDPEARSLYFLFNSQDRVVRLWTDDEPNLKTLLYAPDQQRTSVVDGLGARWDFHYNGQGQIERERTPDGAQTSYQWDRRGHLVRIIRADGSRRHFAYDAAGNLVSETDPDGGRNRFEYNEHRQMVRSIDAGGQVTRYFYDEAGLLLQLVSPGNRVTRYSYTTPGLLTEVIDPAGGRRAFSYDEDGNVRTITDETGAETRFEYDGWGWLSAIIDAHGNRTQKTLDANNREVKLTRPDGSVVETVWDSSGLVRELRQPGGMRTRFDYDALRRLIGITDPLGKQMTYRYDAANNLVAVTDVLGHQLSLEYDPVGRPVRLTHPDGGVVSRDYDQLGRLLRTVDPEGGQTRFEYNRRGLPVRIHDALGHTRQVKYDRMGRVVEETDERGYRTGHRYSREGWLTESHLPDGAKISRGFDALGRQDLVVDGEGNRTSFSYDAAGRLVKITLPDGATRSFAYDALGRMTEAVDEDGRRRKFSYDAMGRRTAQIEADGAKTEFRYDERGNLTEETDPLGRKTHRAYDALNRLTALTDALNRTRRFEYDAVGNLTAAIDALGRRTETTFDTMGRPLKVVEPGGAMHRRRYDLNGNETEYIDPMGQPTYKRYDPLGRLQEQIRPLTEGNESVAEVRQSYAYDAAGNLSGLTDANGHVTRFFHDPMNRLIKRVSPLGHETHFSFDRAGRVVARVDAEGRELRCRYDASGRPLEKTMAGEILERMSYTPSGLPETIQSGEFTTRFTYDAAGRVRGRLLTGPVTGRSDYSYDAAGNLLETRDQDGMRLSYRYDALNRVTSIDDSAVGTWALSYNAGGLRDGLTHPNGMSTRYRYDAGDRLSESLTTRDDQVLARFAYTYDNHSRVLSEQSPQGTRNYTYDTLGRLTQAVDRDAAGAQQQSFAFAYDPAGNRTLMESDSLSTRYEYDADNRLLRAGETRFDYDAGGNRTAKTEGEQKTLYSYDAHDRLSKVSLPGGGEVSFAYDADGRRLLKQTPSGDQIGYLHRGSHVATELRNGAFAKRYVHGPRTDELLGVGNGEGNGYAVTDLRGSVHALFDGEGKLSDRYSYAPFGARTPADGDLPFGFTGREHDPETGLGYFRARYYEPQIGRFLTADPLGRMAGPNTYTYCGNDPVNHVDPSGEAAVTLTMLGLGFLGGVAIDYLVSYCMSRANSLSDYYWSGEYSVGRALISGTAGSLSVGAGAWLANAGLTAGQLFVANVASDTVISTLQTGLIAGLEGEQFDWGSNLLQNLVANGIFHGLGHAVSRFFSAPASPATAHISDIGKGYGGHKIVDRVAGEVTGATNQALRILEVGGTGDTVWGRIYQRVAGSGTWFERVARGNAVQQIAEGMLLNNRYLTEAGVIFNRGSLLELVSSKGRLLRPDLQFRLSNGLWGIIDITTPGQARKIGKYTHKLAPYLINVVY